MATRSGSAGNHLKLDLIMKIKWLKTVSLLALLIFSLLIIGAEIKYSLVSKIRQAGLAKIGLVAYQRVQREGLIATAKAITAKVEDPLVTQELKYSLFDPVGRPPLESAAERASLPEFKVIPGAAPATLTPSRSSGLAFDTWFRSNGNDFSNKFSSHAQIDKDNVSRLALAWTHRSAVDLGDPSAVGTTVQTNPIIVNGRLFVGGDRFLYSIDAATGKEYWRLALPGPVARRGLVWEPHADFALSRLFVPTSAGVYAVGAADGRIRTEFGDKGLVGTELSLIAPLIIKDKLIIATVKPAVEAYDLHSGKLRWTTNLLVTAETRQNNLYGGLPWAGMSGDALRSAVYVSTGNPRPELIGLTRPGDNRNSCSVLSINAETGAINWTFQEVAHDLWDLDVPSPPVLTTITRQGKRVDVVATITKAGNTLLLDRDSGQPIFDYRLKRAPVSTIPGEHTAPYQPAVELPEPFSKLSFDASDVTDLSDGARAAVLRKIRGARMGFFEPPVLGGKIVAFGLQGGAEWPGAAADPRTGILYIPSNRLPWLVRANLLDTDSTRESVAKVPGNALYQTECADCHKPTGEGTHETEHQGDLHYPVLNGITALRDKATLTSKVEFDLQHRAVKLKRDIGRADLETLYAYFSALDQAADRARSYTVSGFWQVLLDDQGRPGSKPPWGQLTALDLNSGRKLWQVPFGEYENLLKDGAPIKGQRNTGGLIATASGLLFATGTVDNRIRAFDAADGRELWSYKLPAAGSAPPSTYMLNGVQYLVVVAGGGQHVEFSGRSDQIMAFRLPGGRQ
jgi:quinoprotein glucose dehydrogenase